MLDGEFKTATQQLPRWKDAASSTLYCKVAEGIKAIVKEETKTQDGYFSKAVGIIN